MTNFVFLSGQAYIRADHIQSVCEHKAMPMFTDARRCELLEPKFTTRNAITLSNGMMLFTNRCCQDLQSAIAEANKQVQDVPMMPLTVSDRIMVDPAYIVAIPPYNPQICEFVEGHSYEIYIACQAPHCLILMADDTCLAVETTPSALMDKLSAQQIWCLQNIKGDKPSRACPLILRL